jgi:hypothetical protein
MFADGNNILTEKFNKPSKGNWAYCIREKVEKSTSSYDNGLPSVLSTRSIREILKILF